ncbi:MAG: hypothetical protein U0R26_06395 [Solirubrobacterales bacterium]
MRSARARLRASAVLGAASAALLLSAAPASAATTVYPSGGSGFDTNAEGWSPGTTSCAPAALTCTSEAAYESGVGNPPGSIAAKTTVTLNLLDLFKATATWNSPQFSVPIGSVTGASVRLDRAFDSGDLAKVAPKATYTVALHDLTAGTTTHPLTEEVAKEDATFATRSAPASVVVGHTYQMSIEATTAQSTLALSGLSGTTALRYDNVGLQVQTAGGGGLGSGSLTDKRLLSLIRSSLVGPAVLKGKSLFVKARCPARVGRACRVSVQGLLKKHKPATTTRTAKIAKGKAKRLVLKVKPKARGRLVKRKRLLFKETVRAGSAKATVYKRLKLIRR